MTYRTVKEDLPEARHSIALVSSLNPETPCPDFSSYLRKFKDPRVIHSFIETSPWWESTTGDSFQV